ncbi:MAG TPA: zinc ribbon domain-containing protein [Paraburkholderia sp.]|nr:zinc ribbon domain-containing protein [Paraburkholderia sp.]
MGGPHRTGPIRRARRTGRVLVSAMPIYDYECTQCGTFDQMRSVAARHTASCPRCGAPAPRIQGGLPIVLRHNGNASQAEDGAYLASGRPGCLFCR